MTTPTTDPQLHEASLILAADRQETDYTPPFVVCEHRLISTDYYRPHEPPVSEASLKLLIKDEEYHEVAESTDGPLSAFDLCLRKIFQKAFPNLSGLANITLETYEVHNLTTGTQGNVCVEVVCILSKHRWHTSATSTDIISASLHALLDAYEFYLHHL